MFRAVPKKRPVALLITALLSQGAFSLSHMIARWAFTATWSFSAAAAGTQMGFGLVLYAMVARTGSIAFPVAVHWTYNWIFTTFLPPYRFCTVPTATVIATLLGIAFLFSRFSHPPRRFRLRY